MFYLFPFGKVPKSERVIIYGLGEVGQSFLRQLNVVGLYECIYVSDKKIASTDEQGSTVFLPEKALFLLPNYPIVIASLKFGNEIKARLISQGISAERLTTIDSSYVLQDSQLAPHSYDWNQYYNNAEGHNEAHFNSYIKPLIEKYQFDFSKVVDFACGKGRIAEILKGLCEQLICVDANPEAIAHCTERFSDSKNVICKVSQPQSIPVESNSGTLICSWDAMVHFDYRTIDYLMTEFSRILRKGGQAVLHHSNAREHSNFEADTNWRKNPHWRSEFNAKDMAHIAHKSGFVVEEQIFVDWEIEALDCITVLRKC